MKTLYQRQHFLEIFLGGSRIQRHFFRCALEKSVVIDVANDQLSRFAVAGVEGGLIQLSQKILLKSFLHGDGIEKELPLVLRFP